MAVVALAGGMAARKRPQVRAADEQLEPIV